MRAVDILWDTDNNEEVSLPEEVELPDYLKDEAEISDYLSDYLTSFCHNGFTLRR